MASSPLTVSEHSRRQRSQSVALVVGVCLGVAVALCFVLDLSMRSDGTSIHLASRINPNTASVGSLVRLPGIGLTRATAIVAFRDQVAKEGGEGVAFSEPGDLQQIRGIGPMTVEGVAPWLRFDGSGARVSGARR
jgi:DNA uptake protein ComE-like DNA-binding protein